jgi:hypothetical protein
MVISESTDWRNFPLTKIRMFSTRLLGDLNTVEFAGLVNAHLLQNIRTHWDQANAEIRGLYHAILARRDYERRQEVEQITSTAEQQRLSRSSESPQSQSPIGRGGTTDAPPSPQSRIIAGGSPIMPAPVSREISTTTLPIGMPSFPPIGRQAPGLNVPESPDTNGAVEQIAELRQDGAPKPESPAPRTEAEQRPNSTKQIATEETSKAQSLELARVQDGDEILARLDEANVALDKANTLEEIKEIADMAAAAHLYARRANRGKAAENKAASYCCRALYKLGTMMPASRAAGTLQKHGRPEKRVQPSPFSDSAEKPRTEKPKTLTQLGLNKTQAAQARKLAKFLEPEFESRLRGKLEKLELSRTATLEDPPLKKAPDHARFLLALLTDFEKSSGAYVAREFAQNDKLRELYRIAGQQFLTFLQSLDVEMIS